MPPSSPFTELLCRGERLALHHERAVLWIARRTLFVADVHLGKEEVFGRLGVAVPHGPSAGDLARLAALVRETGAERLCVLGDLMHDAPRPGERWPAALSAFLDAHASLAVEVVAGNHDRHGGRELVDPRVRWHEGSAHDGPFVLRHEPAEEAAGYVLAGHLHPTCRIGASGRGGDSMRAPAFWFRETHAVLPAFGSFTGGVNVSPVAGERLLLAGPDCVVSVYGQGAVGGAAARRPPSRAGKPARTR